MAKQAKPQKKPIEQYEHKDKKRVNNPPVGLVTPETDPDIGMGGRDSRPDQPRTRQYQYDPHLDPQLVWAGKAERTSFEVPTVSLHVHERIDPRSIIEAVRKKNGNNYEQMSLFSAKEENPPLREAIDFYKHKHNWSNRLIAGDRLLVMNSLLEKEGLGGQVQTIYFDPPYGIKYGSNFQPFVNKRDVKDGKDEDLSSEPETIKAFRDTWELGIHSYLTYIRDTLLLARELLTESGSIFVQISDENVHHVREIMDEVFGEKNFCTVIPFVKTGGKGGELLDVVNDFILWYAKEKENVKYRQLFFPKVLGGEKAASYIWIESPNGKERRKLSTEEIEKKEIPNNWRLFSVQNLTSQSGGENARFPVEFGNQVFVPTKNYWKTNQEGMKNLIKADRLMISGNNLNYIRYQDDFAFIPINNIWTDTAIAGFSGEDKTYVVQTAKKVIQRCFLMTTDPGDLVFDPTCGSGTTAYVAEQWGRRWITCDTSRVAITLTKQRLMTSVFDYYELAYPQQGIGSGFIYETVPHIMLKSIANNEPPGHEKLYDKPQKDTSKTRVTGPFTVEAVPAQAVKSIDDVVPSKKSAPEITRNKDVTLLRNDIGRSGETLRQAEWRDELLKSGIRGKNGQYILFSRVEPLGGTRWLHAEAETKANDKGANSVKEPHSEYGKSQRVVISFGPEHAPLEQRQVELAWEEARKLVPRPGLVIFVAFQFDPEAAKDIDEIDPKKIGMTLLKVQMNADLLTDDLKKKRTSNESFWLIGQPDVRITKVKTEQRDDAGASSSHVVEVLGFDYYNTKTGTVDSGGNEKIAMWLLDTDYDGRSLFPRQVFFPMAGENEGWSKLAKNLKAEIDEELIESYRGTVSLPFEKKREGQKVAIKIIDDRGIESLRVMELL
ncbi:MAG: site-specific DNA-methyltransferase [Bacteroidetes bacterium]|nr:MAG: site-specific DNA-methyltransferase [Bacteroidota bacterium]